MTGRGCTERRGELAARALGIASLEADADLDAHLEGCAACRAELDELRASADALALADPDRLDAPDVVPFLADQIVERVAAEVAADKRRRRRRTVVAAAGTVAAAAVVLVVALVAGPFGNDSPPTVELAGGHGVTGSAILEERPWGTEIALEVAGLDEGHTYWLWLTGDDGERIAAGTLTGTGDPAQAVLGAALSPAEARRIWMTDEADRVVLDATLPSP